MGFSPLEGPVMATRIGSLDYVFAKEFLEII
jgi:acetate kinase